MKTFIFTHNLNKSGNKGRIYIGATRLRDAEDKFKAYVAYGIKIGFYKETQKLYYSKVEAI